MGKLRSLVSVVLLLSVVVVLIGASTPTAAVTDSGTPIVGQTTSPITITVNDSSNGQDTETVSVTIEDQQSGDDQTSTAPSDFPGNASQYNALLGDSYDSVSTFALVDAIEGASDDGQYNGVSFGTFDFVDIIEWNSNQ